jgi:predicted nucleotidyltransferase component of viral defense system
MKSMDFAEWIEKSKGSAEKSFRQAVHTIIFAISESNLLRRHMIFHGGLLMALKFHGIRHTTDIDFVTPDKYDELHAKYIVDNLKEQLVVTCEELSYGLDCRVQSHRINPSGQNRNFQTLQIKVGYAHKGTRPHRKLVNLQSPMTIAIDYSFNERNQRIEVIQLAHGGELQVYSLPDMVAEKYRTMIQQISRNRVRRQDAFDIYWLLKNENLKGAVLKRRVLKSLFMKAGSRDVEVSKFSLRNEEIMKRSRKDYESLSQEIEGELPSFDDVYDEVRTYFESLPWPADSHMRGDDE